MNSLIVEDDPISSRFLEEVLEKHGTVTAAANGKAAVQAFLQARASGKPFDLICLDIMMPEVDGHTVLKQIREEEAKAGVSPEEAVKVIMTTALDDSENILRSYTGRCAAYCVKPIELSVFYGHLQDLGLIR